MLQDRIKKLAKEYHQEIISIRRHLHAHPELSFQEYETGKFISKTLSDLGIDNESGWANTGVVAIIRGEKSGGKVIALRADIDALPIVEENNVPYRSQHPGVMHACGHDVHSASLVGTARILQNLRSEFGGVIKLIFQPGEEKLPGGASLLIKEGVLENPKPEVIVAQHVLPSLESGKVGFRPGMYMASADELYIDVIGKGGHGAEPHKCIDPVVVASQLVLALQQIISRHADPLTPSVLTFGKMNTDGGANNIITNKVRLEGTFRTMNETWRAEAHAKIEKIIEGIALSSGAIIDLQILKGYPFLVNEESLTIRVRQYAKDYLGEQNVVHLPMRMTAEDFAYYSQVIPACFYRIGISNPGKNIGSALHTPTFDADENSLEVSAGLMAWIAIQEAGR